MSTWDEAANNHIVDFSLLVSTEMQNNVLLFPLIRFTKFLLFLEGGGLTCTFSHLITNFIWNCEFNMFSSLALHHEPHPHALICDLHVESYKDRVTMMLWERKS